MPFYLIPIAFVGTLFFLTGLAILVRESRQWLWPRTQGQITRSEVEKREEPKGGRTIYALQMRYWYTVAGKDFTSSSITPEESAPTGERFSMERLQAKYPSGRIVTVYYDPTDPSRAVLTPGFSVIGTALIFLGAVLIVAPFKTLV